MTLCDKTPWVLIMAIAFIAFRCQRGAQVDREIQMIQEAYIPDQRLDLWSIEAHSSDPESVLLTGHTTHPEAADVLIQLLDSLGYTVSDSIQRWPLGDTLYALVTNSIANIRSQPKHSAELSSQVLMGMILRVLQVKDSWWQVKTPDGYIGWIDQKAIVPCDRNSLENWALIPKMIHNGTQSVIYDKASLRSRPIGDITRGGIAQFKGSEDGFTRIGLPDGRIGYVQEPAMSHADAYLSQQELLGDNIVRESEIYVGRPYLWGGSSMAGMDCSGYTQQVFRMNGIQLLRDASQQYRQGKKLNITPGDWDTLHRGDLLFFGRKARSATDAPKITHVAIYLGDGQIIHSTGSVRIESLVPGDPDFAKDRYDSFIDARRIDTMDPDLSIRENPWYGWRPDRRYAL